MEDIKDYLLVILHGGIVSLHFIEACHITWIDAGMFIAITHSAISGVEIFVSRRELKKRKLEKLAKVLEKDVERVLKKIA